MKTIDTLTSALGRPQAVREITSGSRLIAAVGRWRHQGASVNLSEIDTIQLVFNVSGGQQVELWRGIRSLRRVIRAGSVGIVFPGNPTRVRISGPADIVQIIVSKQLVETVSRRSGGIAPSTLTVCEQHLQAAGAQALVALTNDRWDRRGELEKIVRQVVPWLKACANPPTLDLAMGGLSPTARRRVHGLMDERLQMDGCSALALSELAYAAGLSIHHFIKAFRQTEGKTPYASMITRRVDLALALLLQPHGRADWIAEQTGFSSPSHFVSTFRKHMGITPGAVRDAANAC